MYFSQNFELQFPPQKNLKLLGEFIEVAVCMTIFKDENFHFPLKTFISSRIFKEFAIF